MRPEPILKGRFIQGSGGVDLLAPTGFPAGPPGGDALIFPDKFREATG